MIPSKVTVDWVHEQVAKIEKHKDDSEAAHAMEDSLYRSVLQAIAEGPRSAKALAREVLRTQDIDMARWYARRLLSAACTATARTPTVASATTASLLTPRRTGTSRGAGSSINSKVICDLPQRSP